VRIRCSGALGLVVLLATLAACGSADDGAAPTSAPVVSTAPAPTAPTTAPAAPCTWTVEADEPEPDSPSTADPSAGAGPDVAPHEAENNAWRQRGGLTAAEISTGAALAEQLRPVIVGPCELGDFSPDRLSAALQAAVPEGWAVFTIQPRSAAGDPSTGIQVALERDGTCVVGATVPGSVFLRVTAPIADGGCWEPPSH